MAQVSIVVPTLDEAAGIGRALTALQPLRARGAEVLVVDGGSRDGTRELAGPLADRVLDAPRGRAAQMNAGARAARGPVLLFLHADTILPPGALEAIEAACRSSCWGRFDVRIEGKSRLLGLVASLMNLRSRVTGIATGDQAIFVRRSAFESVGGYPAIPLMEDVALSKALKGLAAPVCLRLRVTTSGRRWDREGAWRTVVLMWRLRLAYALGADPRHLASRYGAGRNPT